MNEEERVTAGEAGDLENWHLSDESQAVIREVSVENESAILCGGDAGCIVRFRVGSPGG